MPTPDEERVAEALWEEARARRMTVDDVILAFGPWGGADEEERAEFLALAQAAIRALTSSRP